MYIFLGESIAFNSSNIVHDIPAAAKPEKGHAKYAPCVTHIINKSDKQAVQKAEQVVQFKTLAKLLENFL